MKSEAFSEDRKAARERTVVEWLPSGPEHLRVTRLVSRTFESAESVLRRRPDQILRLAYGDDIEKSARVIHLALHPRTPWLQVPVRVETFTPIDLHGGAVISIRWMPTRAAGLLPTMDADLFVRPNTPESSALELDGRYRPPLGLFGLVVDRIVGRFVASTTAKTFVDHLADAVAVAPAAH